jgi:ABC-type arginine transport system ATPase subunit
MLTVWEHMVVVARSCKVDADWPARAERLLDRLDLADKRDALGDALSKGMRQKVLIAAAVLAGTPVLLMDEPMIGLDPEGQRELRDILVELQERGVAIVVSTHLLEYMYAPKRRTVGRRELNLQKAKANRPWGRTDFCRPTTSTLGPLEYAWSFAALQQGRRPGGRRGSCGLTSVIRPHSGEGYGPPRFPSVR